MKKLMFSTVALALFCSAGIAAEAPKETYKGKQADLNIYLLIGQSNMAGRAAITPADKLPIERFYLADAANDFIPAVHPLNAFSTIRKGLGMQKLNLGDGFARTLLEAMPKEKSIGLVVQARGGSKIESWAKGTKYYNELLKRVAAVRPKGVIRGICWHQGESNNGDEQYLPKLKKLIADLRADLKAPELPFVVGQIRREAGDKLGAINRQLAELPKAVKHTACANSQGLKTQGWHFDSPSLRELGRRYGKEMLKLLAQKPKPDKAKPKAARQ